MMTIRQLRIYAILLRLQELEQERIQSINAQYIRNFNEPPMTLTLLPTPKPLITLYDKKGRPLELPKSKYHK